MTTKVFVFGNNIDTSLTSGITSGTTTIPVASVSGFPTIPAGQYLALTLIHPATEGVFEIVYVTSVSGLNLTVLRGQEGSTAVAWASGDTIFSDVTQGVLQNFNEVIQYNEFNMAGPDTGTTNAYVVALTPPITSYKDGMKVIFVPAGTNTGSATLDAGGGARYIVQGASLLQGYELFQTVNTEVMYDGTAGQWILGAGAIRPIAQPAVNPNQVTILSQLAGLSTGMKNRLINGAMIFDVRNGGASGTAVGYTIDRWYFGANLATKGTWGQNLNSVAMPPNQTAYLGFQSSSSYSLAAGDFFTFYQPIEAWHVADLGWGTANAKPVTISFWVYSSLTGGFAVTVKNFASTRSYPYAYSIPVANTWTYISFTVPGDTGGTWVLTGSVGSLFLQFSMGVGSTYWGSSYTWQTGNYFGINGTNSVVGANGATFYISGVQFEVGSTATQFDTRPITVESGLCQRYYEVLPAPRIQGITYQPNGDTRSYIPWAQPKRAVPTITYTGSTSVIAQGPGGVSTNTSLGTLTLAAASAQGVQITGIGSYSSFSGCGAVFSWGDNGGGSLTFLGDAEL